MKRLRVRGRLKTSHDACTSGTSRVLTVASLQRLKMDVLIPASADCDMRSVIVFDCTEHSADRNSSSAARSMATHGSAVNTSPAGVRLGGVSHPPYSPKFAPSDFHIFLHLKEIPVRSATAFSKWQKGGDECQTVVPIPDGRLLRHRIIKLVPRYDKYLNFGGEYVEK